MMIEKFATDNGAAPSELLDLNHTGATNDCSAPYHSEVRSIPSGELWRTSEWGH
jgi:hypothetical protein